MNKEIKIFIISGKSASGKDTTAKFIKEYCHNKGLNCINMQFSSYIKMYAELITEQNINEETKPRTLLQDLGSIIRENVNKYFFINRIIEDIRICSNYTDIITISDARLPEELDIISKEFKNTYKINIIRPNYNTELSNEQKNHITEIALDNYHNFDYIIINDGNLKDLYSKIENIIQDII